MGMAMFRPTFLGGTPRAFKLIMTDWNKGHFADMLRWQSESQYMVLSVPLESITDWLSFAWMPCCREAQGSYRLGSPGHSAGRHAGLR
jgi:hypothetical protein